MRPSVFFSFLLLSAYPLFIAAQRIPDADVAYKPKQVTMGAVQLSAYESLITGKKIGLVINRTSTAEGMLLPDFLHKKGFDIRAIFTPEHGLSADRAAGEKVADDEYVLNNKNVPVFSLYGSHKKPTPEQLSQLDILVFDMQDVGARFYTYLSTLHYCMEAAADEGIPLLLLDRPNPNGHYVDGPVLEKKYHSFVGMHPIPVVHGCTLGELAKMIQGEKWLGNSRSCMLTVVPCLNYSHRFFYEPPLPPSPSLKSLQSIYLYPSLCLFEGTPVSVGRGTNDPFTCYGFPQYEGGNCTFTPSAGNSVFGGKLCKGNCPGNMEMEQLRKQGFVLSYLIDAYKHWKDTSTFFVPFFDKLAGNGLLRKQIASGMSETDIRKSWKKGLKNYKKTRKKYLLYEDF